MIGYGVRFEIYRHAPLALYMALRKKNGLSNYDE